MQICYTCSHMEDNTPNGFAMILDNTVSEDETEVDAHPVFGTEGEMWELTKDEGKLAVDVAYNDTCVFVTTTMAGAVADRIEVFVHDDLLTIRGMRRDPLEDEKDIMHVHNECFWGVFSRTIVLPTEVKGDLSQATYKSGILFIKIPKRKADAKIPIRIVEE